MTSPRVRVVLYLVLTVAISSVFWVMSARHGMKMKWIFPLMWSPGVAAMITAAITKRPFREFGWGLGKLKYLAAGWWIPMAYSIPAYLLVWITGLGGFPNPQTLETMRNALHLPGISDARLTVIYLVMTATLVTLFSALSALGEEIGWRGFLVPELMRFNSFTRVGITSGFVWAFWHVPLIVWGGYNSGTPAWYAITCFVVMVVSTSFAYAWLRLRANSLWPAVLFHATHNAVIQQFLDQMTVNKGHTNYFIGEFGCALLPFTILVGWFVWKRRSEVEGEVTLEVAA